MLTAVGIGCIVVSLAIFVYFLYLTSKPTTAQDISDRQDKEWRGRHRN